MEEIVSKYELKEKTTLKQLNDRLEILGDNATVDQLVNQTKAIHAQVIIYESCFLEYFFGHTVIRLSDKIFLYPCLAIGQSTGNNIFGREKPTERVRDTDAERINRRLQG